MSNQPERSTSSRGSTGSTDSDDSPPSPPSTPPTGTQAPPPSPAGSGQVPPQPGQQPALPGTSSTAVDRAASSSGTPTGVVTPGGSAIWGRPSNTASFTLPPGFETTRPPSGTQTPAAALPNQANLAPFTTGPNVNQGIPDNVAMFAQPPGAAQTPVGGTATPVGTTPQPYLTPPPTPTGIPEPAPGGGTTAFPTGTAAPVPAGTTAQVPTGTTAAPVPGGGTPVQTGPTVPAPIAIPEPAPGGGTPVPTGTTTPTPTGTAALAPAGAQPTNPQGGGPPGAPAPPAAQMPRAKPSTLTPLFMIQDSGMVDTLAIYCVMPNCTLMFPSRGEHDEHLKKAHGVERFRCLGCTNAYENIEDLGRHVRHHHRSLNGNWRCPECGKIYRTHNKLHKHIYRYHYKGLFKCYHPGCPFGPRNYRDDVYLHYYKEHNTQVKRREVRAGIIH